MKGKKTTRSSNPTSSRNVSLKTNCGSQSWPVENLSHTNQEWRGCCTAVLNVQGTKAHSWGRGRRRGSLGRTWRVPLSLLYSFCDDQEENSALLGGGLTSRDYRDGRILFQVFWDFLLTEKEKGCEVKNVEFDKDVGIEFKLFSTWQAKLRCFLFLLPQLPSTRYQRHKI